MEVAYFVTKNKFLPDVIVRCFALFVLIAFFLPQHSLSAQALATESKLGDLQIGGGFSAVRADYSHQTLLGPTFYATFDVRYHIGVEVDVHMANFNGVPQYSMAEDTYLIGARYNIHTRFTGDKINFYPKFLFGRAVFNNVFASTSSPVNFAYNVYSMGGGVEYKYKPHINIRVVDFEAQNWLGFPLGSLAPSISHGLTPYVVTAGAAYHF